MNRNDIRNIVLGLAVGLAGAGALAGVSLPFTFTAGTPIKSSEVNANFAALNNALPGVAQTASSTDVPITSTPSVASVTINAPGPGYVLVSATAQLNIDYTGSSSARFTFGLSDAADTISPDQAKTISMPSGLPAWTFNQILSAERVFPISSAGPKTFYLLAEENSGVQASVSRRTLTATFMTAMGTVQTTP
jgi:hypothetical protein